MIGAGLWLREMQVVNGRRDGEMSSAGYGHEGNFYRSNRAANARPGACQFLSAQGRAGASGLTGTEELWDPR